MKIKKNLLAGLITLLILLVSACSASSTEQATVQIAEPEQPSAVVPEATQTYTSAPTETPRPTDTPVPSNTPTSTATIRPTKTPTALPENVEMVEMRTPDGIDLVGYLRKAETPINESYVVVLAHGHTQSHKEWASFEQLLNENGITTMSFDFRGHGTSGGTDQFSTVGVDVQTVFDYLWQNGFERIVCIGASMGGSACLAAAVAADIDGLVMLSSPMNLPGTRLATSPELQNLSIPKIFMFTDGDAWVSEEDLQDIHETAEIAGQPKSVYMYSGPAHGSGLFYDQDGEQVLAILLEFVSNLAN